MTLKAKIVTGLAVVVAILLLAGFGALWDNPANRPYVALLLTGVLWAVFGALALRWLNAMEARGLPGWATFIFIIAGLALLFVAVYVVGVVIYPVF